MQIKPHKGGKDAFTIVKAMVIQMKINANYLKLKESYLFSDIAKKTAAYKAQNPDADIIRLGIGDVTLPLCSAVVDAFHKASDEMGTKEAFKGYGPEQGYDFLKNAIKDYYKAEDGVELEADEIFISDGAKSDLGNILDIFSKDNVVLVPDPVYPVYVDTNIMDGRTIRYMQGTAENHFLPMPDDAMDADIIYLCSPNNPTGAAYNHEQLKTWVDFAKKKGAVILFDAAYESFVTTKELVRSIFEIEGARECAIEFCSFSKTAGFTGTRCGWTVVPMELESEGVKLNKLWLRRQTTKFNGVSYPVQAAAAAVFTEEGRKQIAENLEYYRSNAKIITEALDTLGIWYTGGVNSPYIWLKCPNNMGSWDFFDLLLTKANVVGTPGAGFGEMGEGFFRLTAFGDRERTKEAAERIKKLFK